jgi:glycosyltransferase involved in cell wall biosynthesis
MTATKQGETRAYSTISGHPLVSLVVTCYSEPEEFLRECLESVVAQTFSAWEVIVVDDGSVRTELDKIQSCIGDPRISIIRHDCNRGLGAARNSGVRAARASLIVFVDADDRLDSRYLEATVKALEEHPEADWVLTDFQLFGKSDEVWRFPDPLPSPCPVHFHYVGAGALVRKHVWEIVGGYSEEASVSSGVDLDFWLAVAERGFRPVHIARPLYFYRRHSNARSVTTVMYNSHSRAEAIYRRHRRAFEVLGADCVHCKSPDRGRAFRLAGYLTSSIASLRKGERLRAIRLAVWGFIVHPGNPEIRRQMLYSLLPESILCRLQQLKGHLSDLRLTR